MRHDDCESEKNGSAPDIPFDAEMVPKDDAIRDWYRTYVERALRNYEYPSDSREKIISEAQWEMQNRTGLELLLWTWRHVDCREQVHIQDDFASSFGIPMWELIHALEAAEAKQECAVEDPYMDADADQRNHTETNDKATTGGNPYIQL